MNSYKKALAAVGKSNYLKSELILKNALKDSALEYNDKIESLKLLIKIQKKLRGSANFEIINDLIETFRAVGNYEETIPLIENLLEKKISTKLFFYLIEAYQKCGNISIAKFTLKTLIKHSIIKKNTVLIKSILTKHEELFSDGELRKLNVWLKLTTGDIDLYEFITGTHQHDIEALDDSIETVRKKSSHYYSSYSVCELRMTRLFQLSQSDELSNERKAILRHITYLITMEKEGSLKGIGLLKQYDDFFGTSLGQIHGFSDGLEALEDITTPEESYDFGNELFLQNEQGVDEEAILVRDIEFLISTNKKELAYKKLIRLKNINPESEVLRKYLPVFLIGSEIIHDDNEKPNSIDEIREDLLLEINSFIKNDNSSTCSSEGALRVWIENLHSEEVKKYRSDITYCLIALGFYDLALDILEENKKAFTTKNEQLEIEYLIIRVLEEKGDLLSALNNVRKIIERTPFLRSEIVSFYGANYRLLKKLGNDKEAERIREYLQKTSYGLFR